MNEVRKGDYVAWSNNDNKLSNNLKEAVLNTFFKNNTWLEGTSEDEPITIRFDTVEGEILIFIKISRIN